MNNLSDEVFKATFEARCIGSLASSDYVERNIREALKRIKEAFPKKHINQTIAFEMNSKSEPTAAIRFAVYSSQVDEEEIFNLCKPESIYLGNDKEYGGSWNFTLPGIQVTGTLYAKINPSDWDTLIKLGKIKTSVTEPTIRQTIVCEVT